MVCASVREDNQQTMLTASGLSTVQTLKPYNNLLIAPACFCTLCIVRYLLLKIGIYWTCSIIQGSHRNSKTQFHDFSMTFHDEQCNFHDYLMHGLQPPFLAAFSPR